MGSEGSSEKSEKSESARQQTKGHTIKAKRDNVVGLGKACVCMHVHMGGTSRLGVHVCDNLGDD